MSNEIPLELGLKELAKKITELKLTNYEINKRIHNIILRVCPSYIRDVADDKALEDEPQGLLEIVCFDVKELTESFKRQRYYVSLIKSFLMGEGEQSPTKAEDPEPARSLTSAENRLGDIVGLSWDSGLDYNRVANRLNCNANFGNYEDTAPSDGPQEIRASAGILIDMFNHCDNIHNNTCNISDIVAWLEKVMLPEEELKGKSIGSVGRPESMS